VGTTAGAMNSIMHETDRMSTVKERLIGVMIRVHSLKTGHKLLPLRQTCRLKVSMLGMVGTEVVWISNAERLLEEGIVPGAHNQPDRPGHRHPTLLSGELPRHVHSYVEAAIQSPKGVLALRLSHFRHLCN
jgi:hypothetical protein